MSDRSTRGTGGAPRTLDLLGIRCPVNWARAKAVLEGMSRGERLELVTDDPRAYADIPVAAEAEGYLVLQSIRDKAIVRITIER